MSKIIVILFILSSSIDRICGQTTQSQTIGDNILYAACGKPCDRPDMDAITPLSVSNDKQYLVLIVRDSLCSFIVDLNKPEQNRVWGRRHHFKYDKVEALYTIFDNYKSSNKFNVTALFTSGMVSEIWRSVNNYIKKDSDGPLPLIGLGYDMQKHIDASYGWQPDPRTRIVRIIQNDSYYSFDLKAKKRVSGPDSLTKDFSYDYKKLGKLNGAFSRGKDVFFFSGENYFIWKSKDGKKGVLGPKRSILKELYNCDTRYTTPKVPGLVPGVNIRYQSNLPNYFQNSNDMNNKVKPKPIDRMPDPKADRLQAHPGAVNSNTRDLSSIKVLIIAMALISILEYK